MKKKVVLKKSVPKGDEIQIIEFLDKELPLSKSILKEAMIQGSCWLKKGNSKALRRIRRAKTPIRPGDHVEFYYDPMLFERQREGDIAAPTLIKKERDWSAWYKPAGLLSQGTRYGDSMSLLRMIEKETKNEPFLIHRLDRETDGVMVVAHNAKAAKLLSAKWQGTLVQKIYHAWVLGEVVEEEGRLDAMIDGKKAITYFKVLERLDNRTYLELRLGTGRTHQIRKHLEGVGHPIMGDPVYGRKNKDHRGLQLRASRLVFDWHGDEKHIDTPAEIPALDPCLRDS